jgi:hypothetical protein
MMKIFLKLGLIGFLLLATVLILESNQPVKAEPGVVYELVGSVGAGGTAASGSYEMDMVIGQTAVGHHANGSYEMGSGFWGGGVVSEIAAWFEIYLPMIQ